MFNLFQKRQPEPQTNAPEALDLQPRIEFFRGIQEELSEVSLRRNPQTGKKFVVMRFDQLNALDRFRSFTNASDGTLHLIDEEGEITVIPNDCRIIFGGDEGDELRGVICRFDMDKAEHWERFMRFMHRYAEANGFAYVPSA